MTKRTLENLTQEISSDKPILGIGTVAELLGVHQRTLRIYDDLQVLKPSRSLKNRRLYSANDVQTLRFIQYLTRQLGINLMGVKITMKLLEQQGISPDNYHDHIQEITESHLNMSQDTLVENHTKFSRRGRKPANKE